MFSDKPAISPLGFTDTLDQSWKLFQKHIYTFLYITLIIHLPLNILNQFTAAQINFNEITDISAILTLLFSSMGMVILVFTSIVLVPLGTLSVIHVVNCEAQGETINYQQALQKAIPQWLMMIVTGFLAGVFVFVGFLFLIVPGLLLAIFFMFINQSVALREKTLMAAMSHSMQVVRSDGTRIFLVMFGMGMMLLLAYMGLGMIFAAFPEMALFNVISETMNDLVTSFGTVAATLLFLNAESLMDASIETKTNPLN